MSYLRYMCLFVYSDVQHILCCVFCFVCLRLVSRVTNVASFSGLSLSTVVCRLAHVLFTLNVFVCVQRCPTHIVLCFLLFVFTSSYLQEVFVHVLFILFVFICTA
jgi:hypothetical protein